MEKVYIMPEDKKDFSLVKINADASAKEKADNILLNVKRINAAFNNYLNLSASEIISYKASLDSYKAEARSLPGIDPAVMNQIDKAISEAGSLYNSVQLQQQIRSTVAQDGASAPATNQVNKQRETAEKKGESAKNNFSAANSILDFMTQENEHAEYKDLPEDELKKKLKGLNDNELKDLAVSNKANMAIFGAIHKKMKKSCEELGESMLERASLHPHFEPHHLHSPKHLIDHLKKMHHEKHPIMQDKHINALYEDGKKFEEFENKTKVAEKQLAETKKLDKTVMPEFYDRNLNLTAKEVHAAIDKKQEAMQAKSGSSSAEIFAEAKKSETDKILEMQKENVKAQKENVKAKEICQDLGDLLDMPFDGDVKKYIEKLNKLEKEKPEEFDDLVKNYKTELENLFPKENDKSKTVQKDVAKEKPSNQEEKESGKVTKREPASEINNIKAKEGKEAAKTLQNAAHRSDDKTKKSFTEKEQEKDKALKPANNKPTSRDR